MPIEWAFYKNHWQTRVDYADVQGITTMHRDAAIKARFWLAVALSAGEISCSA